MVDYIARVIAAGLFGAAVYFATWLLFGFAFRMAGMAGAALLNVALLHVAVQYGRTWKEVL
jgi:hypothetical protein